MAAQRTIASLQRSIALIRRLHCMLLASVQAVDSRPVAFSGGAGGLGGRGRECTISKALVQPWILCVSKALTRRADPGKRGAQGASGSSKCKIINAI